METPRKIDDCYFYYYSTCTKGDTCHFRHEPSALGRETMCFNWQQGKCFEQQCNLRHMELRKNRKQIPCYWESQPGGCRKKFCPFQHTSGQPRPAGVPSNDTNPQLHSGGAPPRAVNRETGEVADTHRMPLTLPMQHPASWHPHQRQGPLENPLVANAGGPRPPMEPSVPISPLAAAYSSLPAVDSLVVNFEEESDSESMPTLTPIKNRFLDEGRRIVKIKSLEQIRLERIQAEAAAFYYYDPDSPGAALQLQAYDDDSMSNESRDHEMRIVTSNKLPYQYESLTLDEIHQGKDNIEKRKCDNSDDFKILSLHEIRAIKRRKMGGDGEVHPKVNDCSSVNGRKRSHSPDLSNVQAVDDKTLEAYLKSFRTTPPNKQKKADVESVKVTPTKPKLIRKRHPTPCDSTTNDPLDSCTGNKQQKTVRNIIDSSDNLINSESVDCDSQKDGVDGNVTILLKNNPEIKQSELDNSDTSGTKRYLLPNLIPDLIASCAKLSEDNTSSVAAAGSNSEDSNILQMIDQFLES